MFMYQDPAATNKKLHTSNPVLGNAFVPKLSRKFASQNPDVGH